MYQLGLLLLALGAGAYWWGRWRAVVWLGVVPWFTLAVVLDVLWQSGIWDRSDEYEPLPLSMFVIPFWIPAASAVTALGVALSRARGRASSPRARSR